MNDLVRIEYGATGRSQATDEFGMREMQRKVFDRRASRYLLIKSPPASGKSRALMFLGLDKLRDQGMRKVVVAVPERSIGASFRSTSLSKHGFPHDWDVENRNDLCSFGGGERGKIAAFRRFMESDDEILVCTHATLRHAFDAISSEQDGMKAFDDCLLAIDEFHHVSADADNRLGELVRDLMERDRAHIAAMTGSYFRGDRIPVLRPEQEERFVKVVYTYYEQLSGYEHLRSLGIGYHFYHGIYLNSLSEVLDPALKTIIHIPSVNSSASTRDKIVEMNRILDLLGDVVDVDPATGFQIVRQADGTMLRIAELVTPDTQQKVLAGLRAVEKRDDVDIVIALGMAKEGFDWIWCEHALTVGARGSLTEIVQIIGRTTRDAPGKTHAQFTNLIAEPDASDVTVRHTVNDFLKAIACSLLMEQVMAPNFAFKTRPGDDAIDGSIADVAEPDDDRPAIHVKGLLEPRTERGRQIVANLDDLMAAVAQDERVLRASIIPEEFPAELVTRSIIPEIIVQRYPELEGDDDELEAVRHALLARQAIINRLNTVDAAAGQAVQAAVGAPPDNAEEPGANSRSTQFLDLSRRLILVGDLNIDLIDSVNPFQDSYSILSKAMDGQMLRRIHNSVMGMRIDMSEAEAMQQWPRIQQFNSQMGREPSMTSNDPAERRMAEALEWLRAERLKRSNAREAERVI